MNSESHPPPPKTRERLPLKTVRPDQQHGGNVTAWLPASNETHFRLVVISIAVVTLAVTAGLFADIARDPTQLKVHRGTVFAEVDECVAIGRQILWEGGNAVDASVATLLCLTVASPHTISLGSGGFMLIMKPEANGVHAVINFREMAPSLHDEARAHLIGSRVAVPGVLRGLQAAHDKFGALPWKRLVMPSADLAKNGFRVSKELSDAISSHRLRQVVLNAILSDYGLSVKTGDIVTRRSLASTMVTIAEEGPDAFYHGNLTDAMVDDLLAQGASLTRKDFETYKAIVDSPLEISIGGGAKLLVPPLPSSGPALGIVLAMMSALNQTTSTSLLEYHHLIEAIKIAIAATITAGSPVNSTAAYIESENMLRSSAIVEMLSHIMDDSTIALDSIPILRQSATAATVLVESDGTLVALVGSLGSAFGSQVITSNGILFNDAMEDFFPLTSPEDYKNNVFAPGRRPLSQMVVAALLSETESNSSCSDVRLLGASADFQLLAQAGLVRIWRMDSDVLEKAKFWATLTHSSGGDVAIQVNDRQINGELLNQLHQLGHMVYETDVKLASIASLRYGQHATVIQVYPNLINPKQ